MSEETFTGYVTKYALTVGIIETELERISNDQVCAKQLGLHAYFHGQDWHETLSGARAKAETMRARKLASIQKQIKDIEAKDLTVAVRKP